MDDLRIDTMPSLESPLMLLAYRGWNDAGSAATYAIEYLIEQSGAEQFGAIDHDEYYDFTQARPHTRPLGEYQRELTWPKNELYAARLDDGRDVVFLLATEPHLRWRRYGQNVVRLAQDLGVTEALALGSLLADTPHTRPVPLSGGASTADFAGRLRAIGIGGSGYEGPTGILSVVGSMLAEVGVPNGSIWAAVPHYISAAPNPRATLAIVRSVEALLGLDVPVARLEDEADVYAAQVESAMATNPEAQQYVRELEFHSESGDGDPTSGEPEAEEFGGEPLDASQADVAVQFVEDFLRRQREDHPRDER